MELKDIFPHLLDAVQALAPYYDPSVCRAGEEFGLDAKETYLLIALPSFEPDSITVPILNIRSPYTAPEIYAQRLDSIARSGLLVSSDALHYSLTERGKTAHQHIMAAAHSSMAAVSPLPSSDMKELMSLLADRVAACLETPEPPGKWCISHSRKLDPGPGAADIVRVDQYLSDLLAYRDDSHLASWKAHNVDGHAWDILTLLWINESETIDSIQQKLARRGNSAKRTEKALKMLINDHWIESSEENFTITAKGSEIRQKSEWMTDEYFYAPWKSAYENQIQRLVTLLINYTRGLNV